MDYKEMFYKMLEHYEEVHVNPWHEITKEEILKYAEKFFNENPIMDDYLFTYLILSTIKKVSGKEDCHTMYSYLSLLPINYRLFGDELLVNHPKRFRGYKVKSISGVSIDKILEEVDALCTYGTEGRRRSEIENTLFNQFAFFSLPSLRDKSEAVLLLESPTGKEEEYILDRKKGYLNHEDIFDYDIYSFGEGTKYEIKDDILIYTSPSFQPMFTDAIAETVERLKKEDVSNVSTMIIDLRGNHGGRAANNKPILEFIKMHPELKLIVLTDYRVFSGGRYAVRDFMELGATFIGEQIGTPMNCYGNNNWIAVNGRRFSASEYYFHPTKRLSPSTKEEFKEIMTPELLEPEIFIPDIEVNETKEDYLIGVDIILETALEYIKENKKKI